MNTNGPDHNAEHEEMAEHEPADSNTEPKDPLPSKETLGLQLERIVKSIEVLHHHLNSFDLGAVVISAPLSTTDFITELQSKLSKLDELRVQVLDFKLSDAAGQLGDDFSLPRLLDMLPNFSDPTIFLMMADIDNMSDDQIVHFSSAVVPNLAERDLADKLIEKKSHLMFVFTDQNYERYRSTTLHRSNGMRRTLDGNVAAFFRYGISE